MAVKVATKVTLSLRELSKALIAKTTTLYANKDMWGRYSYEDIIYPQARTAFKDLYPTSLYPTNEEFIERFRKDYYIKGGALQKLIARGETGQENEIIFNQPDETANPDATPLERPGGEPAGSMVGGIPNIPRSSTPQRIILRTPSEPISTAVTDKAERLAQENPAAAKIGRQGLPSEPQIPSIKTGGNTGVPKIFEDAFQGEPEFKLNQQPPKVPSIQTTRKTGIPTANPTQSSPNIGPAANKAERIKSSPLSNIGTNPGVKYKTGFTNTLKNITSGSGRFFQRNIGKYATAGRIATLASTGIGGVAGFAVGGSPGALFGAAAGFSAPSYLKSRGTQDLKRIGNGIGNVVTGTNNKTSAIKAGVKSGKSALSKIARRRKFWIFGSIIFFVFGFALIAGLGGATGPSGGGSSTTPGGNVGVGTGIGTETTSDIMSCKFGRAGDGADNEISYKSPLLLSYIQEASSLTSIPPAVLAAFIRVETGSTVSKTDAEIQALSSVAACPRNPVDGGLGVMQLQPKGKLGHYEEGIANGARLIGKNYDDLTEEDYCDVKKNIIMGAGFILKKLQRFGYGDGTRWQPEWTTNQVVFNSMATGYYGCLRYGSSGPCDDPGRIYSYGKDVWDSVQNCKTTNATATLPTTGSTTLDTIINTAANITSSLSKGGDGNYNARPGTSGTYFCTYLVIDSYNAAGLTKLNKSDHGGVRNMAKFFANTTGYQLAPPDTEVKYLRPGDIIIFEAPGVDPNQLQQHVNIIKSIEVREDGIGTITTFDANNYVVNDKVTVSNFRAERLGGLSTYKITGFGQITAL